MAISCDPQTLATQARCLVEYFSRIELKAIRIYLLCNYVNGVTVSCDPQQLKTNSECILEKLSLGDMEAAETYLTCQIASGSAPATTGLNGVGSPEGVVTASPGASYLQTDTGSLWYKRTGNGNTGWIEIVA